MRPRIDPWKTLKTLRSGESIATPILYDTSAIGISSRIVERLVTLANTFFGGVWFVGVYGTQRWREVGDSPPAEFESRVREAQTRIKPCIPEVRVETKGNVAAVAVEGLFGKVSHCFDETYSPDHGTYLYDRGECWKAPSAVLQELRDRDGESDFELEVPPAVYPRDLEAVLMRSAGVDPDNRAELVRAGVTTASGSPTVAGCMAFGGADVFRRHSALGIRWQRFEHGMTESQRLGNEPVESGYPSGPLVGMVEWATCNMVDWLPASGGSDLGRRLCRELIVNALAHRTLSPLSLGFKHADFEMGKLKALLGDGDNSVFEASPVVVDCYPDMTPVVSPGGLPVGSVRLLGPDRVQGRLARNPHLIALLTRYNLASQRGLGLAYAQRLAPANGCRLEFNNSPDSFEVRLLVDPAQAVSAEAGLGVSPSRRRMSPAQRKERVVALLEDGPMTSAELIEALGWPPSTVRLVLKNLTKKKVVRRTERAARSPNQRYFLC